jgi:uncharacterized membrane protein
MLMTEHALVLLLALLIGVVAGSRTFTAPAVMSWAGFLRWIDIADKWSSWVANPITVAILTVMILVESVADQLPTLPNRTAPPQFIARLISGGFAGAVLGSAWHYTWTALGFGVVGAVLGTFGFFHARKRLVAATGGRDQPIGLLEDVVAAGGGFLIAYVVSKILLKS